MNKPNLGIADLNLLRVFLAIWDLRSLTAAGDRLGLTQPAVSHALRRLRNLFEDPLFVRRPTGMVPTEAAFRLYPPLAQALSIINDAVQQHAKFDPATARREFRISMSDMSEFLFSSATHRAARSRRARHSHRSRQYSGRVGERGNACR
jgi:Transcriptional regulator